MINGLHVSRAPQAVKGKNAKRRNLTFCRAAGERGPEPKRERGFLWDQTIRLLCFEPLYQPKGMNRFRYQFELKSLLLTL